MLNSLLWNGYVGRRVAASTRDQRRLGIVLLVIAGGLAIYASRTLINLALGPVPLDESQLSNLRDPTFLARNYATVESQYPAANTGLIEETTTKRNGSVVSRTTTAEYVGLIVGSHVLIVKARPNVKSTVYTGGIVSAPDDLRAQVQADLEDPEWKAAVLPIMLDTVGYVDDDFLIVCLAAGALVLTGVVVLILDLKRRNSPEQHPLCRAIARYGPLESLVPLIDSEAMNALHTPFSAKFSEGYLLETKSWIIQANQVMRREEIVWVYKRETKTSINAIPTGTTHAAMLCDSMGQQLALSGSSQEVDVEIQTLAQLMPWIILGYDQKIEQLYQGQREAFLEVIAQRRKTAAAVAGASE
jgi:hypothetical protein